MNENLQKYLSSKACNVSDLSFANNPNLEVDRASSEYITLLKDNSQLLSDITVVDRADCKGQIPRFDMCGIGSAGANATSCVPGNTLEDSYITYDMIKYKTGMTVDEDMLDCNEYGRQLNDIAFSMLQTKVRNDMELAAILSDADLPTGDGQSDYNNLMGVNDGFLKLALAGVPAEQIIDAAGAGPSVALFMAIRKKLPKRYRKERAQYRYIVGPSLYDWFVENRSERSSDFGDEVMESGRAGRMFGTALYEVPMWPEDLNYNAGAQEVTHIMYTPLSNLVYFVRRRFEFETERRISCDDYQSVAWWTADFAIAEPERVVLATNVDVCGTAWTGCEKMAEDCGPSADPTHVL